MAENAVDRIVENLGKSGAEYFPQHSEVKAVRVVGRAPKLDHYIYEIVVEFADDSKRVSAKVYRAGKCGSHTPQELAKTEAQNLEFAFHAAKRSGLEGVPRPLGDFTGLGAIVSIKVDGPSLQSVILRTALLPDLGGDNKGLLQLAAQRTGQWLRQFHKATAQEPAPLDTAALLSEMEQLCHRARKNALPATSTEAILENARSVLWRQNKPLPSSTVLNDFVPLNVLVTESGVGFCDFANLTQNGNSLHDAAVFLAAIEALEKYPFCDRRLTASVQDAFLDAYGIQVQEERLLTVLKMKVLLQMFTQGRAANKESAERKKVMWANVMKRFIQQAADRTLAPSGIGAIASAGSSVFRLSAVYPSAAGPLRFPALRR